MPTLITRIRFVAVLSFTAFTAACAITTPPTPILPVAAVNPAIEARVENLLAQMTLDEKIDYIGGYKGFNIRPVPRLDLPEIILTDGPAGVRNFGKTTAYPAPVTLAAAFDTNLAHTFGESIARDSKARGVHVWLGPGMNLTRQPQGGRNFEYFGEDPYLTSRMAVSVIKGVQSQGVAATAKHFIANDQEHDRNTVSSQVDQRTLREIYLRPFEAAVTEAGVWNVMTSYNLINGVHASENEPLITGILKNEWGFPGVVMSDWTSVYSSIGPVRAGLDLEMPKADFMNAEVIKPLLASGDITIAQIDDKVRRILRMIISMGFLDHAQRDNQIPLDDSVTAKTALQIAREGIVLLKNTNAILPLKRTSPQRILIVGPNADPAVTGGGGSSLTIPHHAISLLEAIREAAGPNATIDFLPIGGSQDRQAYDQTVFMQPESNAPGLKAEYFNGLDLAGEVVATRIEEHINHDWPEPPAPGLQKEYYSARWTGRYRAAADGDFLLAARADDGFRAWFDGELVIDMWRDQAATKGSATRHLTAGSIHDLRIEYYQRAGGAIAQFGIVPPRNDEASQLKRAAASADIVIASVGFDQDSEGEGFDHPFALPPEQESLLRELVAIHPRTIVVLNSGASVDARAWADRAAAMLMAWYPGQSGNQAVAEILFGETNPSGKLPITFEHNFADSYANLDYPPQKDGILRYAEGVFMGYRHADRAGIQPLFPFGHGLSYTTFAINDLRVRPTETNDLITVAVNIANTGSVAGDQVVQAYVAAPGLAVPRPKKELKALARITLKPGESREVNMTIRVRDLAYWDELNNGWAIEPGTYRILVGSSSADLPLSATITRP